MPTNPFSQSQTDTAVLHDEPWHVVVLNDPVNTMPYVVMVFRRIFGFDLTTATIKMREVHELGRSRVWSGERETAEHYLHILHQWQLSAILEHEGGQE